MYSRKQICYQLPSEAIKHLDMSITCQQPAARLALFVGNWALITQDQWVLQAIQGYHLDLVSNPTQSRVPSQIQLPLDLRAAVTLEVSKLLDKGVIAQATASPTGFTSQLFLVPKKDGGLRPVLNLKALNRFIQWEHFQMEGLHMLPDILMPNNWMVKLDLKDAYLQVPIHQAHHQFLKFQWEGRMYYSQCLKISSGSYTSPGIPRFHHQNPSHDNPPPKGETEEDKAGGSVSACSGNGDNQGSGQFHWQDLSFFTGNPHCPIALQVTSEDGQLSCSIPLLRQRDQEKILNVTPTDPRGPRRPAAVDQSAETVQHSPNPITNSESDNRVRCFKHGMGCSMSGSQDWRFVVKTRSSTPHQLSGASGSISGPEIIYEREEGPLHSPQNGQHNSLDKCQQNGRAPLTPTVLFSPDNVELVSTKTLLDQSRTSPRNVESGSGHRVSDSQGQVRLDAEPSDLYPVQICHGTPSCRCLPLI